MPVDGDELLGLGAPEQSRLGPLLLRHEGRTLFDHVGVVGALGVEVLGDDGGQAAGDCQRAVRNVVQVLSAKNKEF